MGRKRKRLSLDAYYAGIVNGDRTILAQSITLVESELFEDRMLSRQLLDKCFSHTGNSCRIGITGVPGVGKSTFIDAFGEFLIEQHHKVAVLAIDPSSAYSRGSILGDKTRMQFLSMHPQGFVRPSPNSGTLGGVARKTRESLLLCEAAGFDMILVETVGVGQSELAVKGMTDFFLLLMLPNAGDELQGIKRGIMEMADLVFINKADGEFEQLARKALQKYRQALRLINQHATWEVPVISGSALLKKNLDTCLTHIQDFQHQAIQNQQWQTTRNAQTLSWLKDRVEELLIDEFWNTPGIDEKFSHAQKSMDTLQQSPDSLAESLIEAWQELIQKKRKN